ncbi:hypothetical protein J6590_080036 [Homalodisca vitripennis]|nr:hypothetical protein J6590_080036 [Homalodisca vitripennis]
MSWILIIIFFLVVMCFGKFICGRLFREWTQNISEKSKNLAIQGAREVGQLQNTMSDEDSLPTYKRQVCREPTPAREPFQRVYVLSKAEKNAIKTFENCKKVWALHNLDVPEGLIKEFEHFHKVWKIPKLTPSETVTKEEEPISVNSQVSMHDEQFKGLHKKLSYINIMAGPSNEKKLKNEKFLNMGEEPQLKVEQTFSGDKVEEEKFISKKRHVYTHNRNVKECYYQVCYNDVILPTANRTVGNREVLVVLLPPVSENASQFEENNSELSDDNTEHVMLDIIDEEDEEDNEVFDETYSDYDKEELTSERVQACKHDGQCKDVNNKLSNINILMAGPSNENDLKIEKLLNVCEETQLKVEQTFSGDKVEYQVCYNDVILPTANRTVGNREVLIVLLPPVSKNASQFEENNSELSDDNTEHVMLDIIDEEDEENNEVFKGLWPKAYNEAIKFERPYKQLSAETKVGQLPDLDTKYLSSSSIDSTCG